jgi:integrase
MTPASTCFAARSGSSEQLVTLSNAPAALSPPKTEASRRTVPLPQVVVDELAAYLAAFPVVHPWGLVFTTARGTVLQRNRFGESVWRPAVTKVGLPEGTGFHQLRHYYASALIAAGVSPKVVQARLGHATISETMDTYGHLWPDSDERTRAAIDATLSRPGHGLGTVETI